MTGHGRGGKTEAQRNLKRVLLNHGGEVVSNVAHNGLQTQSIKFRGKVFTFVEKAKNDRK